MLDPTRMEGSILEQYLSALDPPDMRAARLVATAALDSGMAPGHFIATVLRPAQVEVGRRWQINEWTVAQEHTATAITDAVLALISLHNPREAWSTTTIVSGCVEGDWHTMPLRMLGATLAGDGYDVTFLGPSLAAAPFARSLHELRPAVALLSCTMSISLSGARRTVEVAHEAGVPVIVGGRAFDADGIRATAIGADAWASSAADVIAILASWQIHPPAPARAADVVATGAELEVPEPGLVEDCLIEMLRRQPPVGELTEAQLARKRADIVHILQTCSATSVTGDRTVLDEFTTWLRDVQGNRGEPADSLPMTYRSIAAVLGGHSQAATMLTAAATSIEPRGSVGIISTDNFAE